MFINSPGLHKEDQEMPAKRPRRNSDSVVLVRSRENEAMKFYFDANLKKAEIKFQEKKESVEKKNEKRRSQSEEGVGLAEEASTSEQTTETRRGEKLTTE